MILDGLKLSPPWLTKTGEDNYIVRLGYKGIGYRVNEAEAGRISRLYKRMAIPSIMIFCILAALFIWMIVVRDRSDQVATFLIHLMFLIPLGCFSPALSAVFFKIVKVWLGRRDPVDEGLGYWEVKARRREQYGRKTYGYRGFLWMGIVWFLLTATSFLFRGEIEGTSIILSVVLLSLAWQNYMIIHHRKAHPASD
ncbi:hypothetical protein [Kordiimonas sp. SCSIO 12610]|uniref:hypothetical protein n=1 Tax=Kordiimonas sp. SCSIO 12610 TaxID=2829597 RepID=UPI002108C3F4|nr:hypothetical protein [Kordiimonas sp. SCSIO 12610]UTW56126.1 hypothetical protein KFF44_04315 [Kordiimonas sp. SCSIO 12610]